MTSGKETRVMPVETFKENGFTVHIEIDQDTDSPREDDSPACKLVMFHRRYNWPNDAGVDLDAFGGWDEVATELTANHGALVVQTIYAYEHGGIAFKVGERTGQFADPWDSGVAGLAYVTREIWQDTQGTEWTGSDADIAQAEKLISADVEIYGQWLNGETYGYRIVDEYGEEVDSCWGFIGHDNVTEAAKESANALEHESKCNGTFNRATGEIDHEGACPLHGGK